MALGGAGLLVCTASTDRTGLKVEPSPFNLAVRSRLILVPVSTVNLVNKAVCATYQVRSVDASGGSYNLIAPATVTVASTGAAFATDCTGLMSNSVPDGGFGPGSLDLPMSIGDYQSSFSIKAVDGAADAGLVFTIKATTPSLLVQGTEVAVTSLCTPSGRPCGTYPGACCGRCDFPTSSCANP
jgi:hypothetical protein